MLDNYMSYSSEEKLRIIEYSYKHGIDKTLEALELDSRKLSRRTLCRWRKIWKRSLEDGYGVGNLYDLSNRSKRPRKCRRSETCGIVLEFIQRTRLQYPTLGKDKLKILVDQFCEEKHLRTISSSTIGRVLSKFKTQRRIPNWTTGESKKVGLNGGTGKLVQIRVKKKNVKTRRKDYLPESSGDLVQIDCVTYLVKQVRRYLVCGVDLKSRFSLAIAYDKLNSDTAKDFFQRFQKVFPYTIKHVQTDNGQEFHKHFENHIKQSGITQFWNYPKSPKMNAYVERFNRTVQEEFANYKQWVLRDDLKQFNSELINWLIFYNFERPHLGLKKDTGQFISPMQYLKQHHPTMCHMWWTGTMTCEFFLY